MISSLPDVPLSSRANRRKALKLAIDFIERIRFAEEDNLERFPFNFRDSAAFANADLSHDILIDAIISLGEVYDD